MSYAELERQAKLKYLGEFKGWKPRHISKSEWLALPADQGEWYRVCWPTLYRDAVEGKDPETLKRKFAAGLVFANRWVKVQQHNGTAYAECFVHPEYSHLGFIARLSDGNYYQPETQWKEFEYVTELPPEMPPQSFADAALEAKRRAVANLATQRAAVRKADESEERPLFQMAARQKALDSHAALSRASSADKI